MATNKQGQSAEQARADSEQNSAEDVYYLFDRVPWLKTCTMPFQTGFTSGWHAVVSPSYRLPVPAELLGTAPFQAGQNSGMTTGLAYRKFLKVRVRASELLADYTSPAPRCKNEAEFVGALRASLGIHPDALSSFKWRHRGEDWQKDYKQGWRKQQRRKKLVAGGPAPELAVLYSAIVTAEPEFDDSGELCALKLPIRVTSVAALLRTLFLNIDLNKFKKMHAKCSELGLRLRRPGRPRTR